MLDPNVIGKFDAMLECIIPKISERINFRGWLEEIGYFEAPASRNYHGAYPSGLLCHSVEVASTLSRFSDNLMLLWERECSPYVIGLFHDLCKCDMYVETQDSPDLIKRQHTYHHNKQLVYEGHGAKSILLLAAKMQLTQEEIACIRYHMGFSFPEDTAGYLCACKQYPNILMTHMADMWASQIKGV